MLKRILAALSFSRFLRLLPALTLCFVTSMAYAASPNIVISQIYGGGGNTGAPYKNDFIELFNRGNSPVSVAGWSVQYASATGTSWALMATLTGTIPAGGYYLVQGAGGVNGISLPTSDATGTTNMSGTAGKVALVNTATALPAVACPTSTSIVDFVGFGTTANCFEGASFAPAPSSTTADFRASAGCTDTDVNSANFTAGAPNPRNSATTVNACNIPDLTINDVSIVEGNSGTTTFTFTVSLSAAAGVGGVTFNIATADGTATVAGSDYVAKSLTSQSIPQGMSSYTFTVDVNGDLTPETNETFFVNVTNLVGALPLDTQGLGTIVNDDSGPDLNISSVSQSEGNSGTSIFTFTVSLSTAAPPGGVTFNIATADGTATAGSDYVASSVLGATIAAGNLSYTFDVVVNGDTTPEPNETFFVNVSGVTNAVVITSQGIGTIINEDLYRIHDVQGSGTSSPLVGQQVLVEGIVTGVFQGANSLNGFYIQEPDALVDADPATSEGVFVFTSASPAVVSVGDLVRVSGNVIEFGTAPSTLTEIVTPTVTVLSTGNPLPAITDVTLPVAALTDLERYEGMRVRFLQTLTVSDHFTLARFGEISLKANGRALQPTNIIDVNDDPASGTTSTGTSNLAAVQAYGSLNQRSSIILDDADSRSYPPVVPFVDPVDHTLRLGSTLDNLTGIFSQSFGSYRVFATTTPAFNYAARPATPPAVGGNVKVASANVLNYFNGNGATGVFPTSRGANSLIEFNRQKPKVIAALLGLNADVIGLLEIQNNSNHATPAIQDLVDGLNAATSPGTWAFMAAPANYGPFGGSGLIPGGSDEIRPAIIYKPAVVAPVGVSTSPNDAAFNLARAPIAQTFKLISNDEQFTLVINHFKSKGSGTGLDADQNDGQGASNYSRRLQAQALLTFIGTLTTATPRVITMG
ncbi:MAG: ExeM/NucH family extracellular endonuclease, partial [Burkholderiales bacterium]|nr:ExeM/NucH family extracellular endonuclease [Burkholderiales bacterium]